MEHEGAGEGEKGQRVQKTKNRTCPPQFSVLFDFLLLYIYTPFVHILSRGYQGWMGWDGVSSV